MMFEPTYTTGPFTQPSFIESSSRPGFIEPPHIEIPPPQEPLALDHSLWMDLYAQISSLGTRMEELVIVSDTQFYSIEDRMDQFERIEDRMDQHQVGFTSQSISSRELSALRIAWRVGMRR
ncbi:hypothetical protein AAG906_017120 [Vitis piasezkii]